MSKKDTTKTTYHCNIICYKFWFSYFQYLENTLFFQYSKVKPPLLYFLNEFRSLLSLFHWNKRSNISSAYWASVFGFDQTFSTFCANAKMTARHNESVFDFGQTDETLLLGIVDDHILDAFYNPSLHIFIILLQSVNWLQLKGHIIYLHTKPQKHQKVRNLITIHF